MGEATKGIMQKARMAKDLYEQQAAIENQVKERCAPCSLLVPSRIRCLTLLCFQGCQYVMPPYHL